MPNVFDRIHRKLDKALSRTIPKVIARVGINHFRESFKLQRYNEAGAGKWPEVERRKEGSPWYGFKYRNRKNFSAAATRRAVLFGSGSSKLRDSIFTKEASRRGVEWASSSKYATIHNRGGHFKVFGRTRAVMPKRQFMGLGTRLRGKIKQQVRIELKKALL